MTARACVALSFALNGVLFATLTSRLPTIRSALDLGNGDLGLLLLSGSAASVLALVGSGRLITRFGATAVVRAGAASCSGGLTLVTTGVSLGSVVTTALGLYIYGTGVSLWDVAMNLEGAEVERRAGRTIMPRFHAAWSGGSIAGAGLGVLMLASGVPISTHVFPLAVAALAGAWWSAGRFLPATTPTEQRPAERGSAWLEPRTLAIGVMVLAFAVVEGVAFDWLALGLIDGYDVAHWVGNAGFALFVMSMLAGRMVGPIVLDRRGRAVTLWACAGAAFTGSLITVFGGHPAVAAVGIVVWGLGASLGFPVGLSAAADDPGRAAARMSVVSTIGYGAFLAGPPLLGWLADQVGTLRALLAVAVLMVPAAVSVLAARPTRPVPSLPAQKLEL